MHHLRAPQKSRSSQRRSIKPFARPGPHRPRRAVKSNFRGALKLQGFFGHGWGREHKQSQVTGLHIRSDAQQVDRDAASQRWTRRERPAFNRKSDHSDHPQAPDGCGRAPSMCLTYLAKKVSCYLLYCWFCHFSARVDCSPVYAYPSARSPQKPCPSWTR